MKYTKLGRTLPKIALGAWAWGNDGTFGGNLTADTLRHQDHQPGRNEDCAGLETISHLSRVCDAVFPV